MLSKWFFYFSFRQFSLDIITDVIFHALLDSKYNAKINLLQLEQVVRMDLSLRKRLLYSRGCQRQISQKYFTFGSQYEILHNAYIHTEEQKNTMVHSIRGHDKLPPLEGEPNYKAITVENHVTVEVSPIVDSCGHAL